MNIKQALVSVITNWNNFHGRACRSEFWYFILVASVISFLISFLEAVFMINFSNYPAFMQPGIVFTDEIVQRSMTSIGPLSLIFNIIILIPSISVTSRRLQDRSISGWWQLSYFLIIGVFIITIICMFPSKETTNKWGSNPLKDEKNL